MKELKLTFKEAMAIVADKTGLTQVETTKAVEAYIDVIKETLTLGRGVAVKGLGNFGTKTVDAKEAYMGRNPHTGEDLLIPAKEACSKVTFKISKTYQDEFKENTAGKPLGE